MGLFWNFKISKIRIILVLLTLLDYTLFLHIVENIFVMIHPNLPNVQCAGVRSVRSPTSGWRKHKLLGSLKISSIKYFFRENGVW